ncbi:DNA-3-methyladenine glycosylase family protein [Haloimpatiens lingqiaonensis]|uniref:DNA-3-methyladenine glycosylase family protein n=1 Tax=Haloimpatiens lingqiaonensis TaxID=1380675 RepID=UPI0010FE5AC5|nr:DNA-3-methyladenine glycosylase [Haloimpatiens lingqiaonensis]
MDFQYVEELNDKIIIKNVRNFELADVFDCGQCFRWSQQENGNYIGVAMGKVIEIEKNGEDIIIYNTDEREFKDIWAEYFDLYRDYGTIKDILKKDPTLEKAVEFGEGIRILKQEPFEILISFIISANNRIPMIKRAINNISKKYGEKIEYKGEKYYTFPTIEKLHEANIEELEECGVGFRAKYIVDTVEKLYKGDMNLEEIKKLNDDKCHEEIQKFSGVGPKVGDCVMLFSMQKYSAFPVDVWVKRAMHYFYLAPDVSLKKIREFAREKFQEFSGFAQQYLFYYARENKIDI